MVYGLLFRKCQHSLLLIPLIAPGQRAFNIVEHSMSSLTKLMSSVTLPINYYGEHLVNKEVPPDLEETEQ